MLLQALQTSERNKYELLEFLLVRLWADDVCSVHLALYCFYKDTIIQSMNNKRLYKLIQLWMNELERINKVKELVSWLVR